MAKDLAQEWAEREVAKWDDPADPIDVQRMAALLRRFGRSLVRVGEREERRTIRVAHSDCTGERILTAQRAALRKGKP